MNLLDYYLEELCNLDWSHGNRPKTNHPEFWNFEPRYKESLLDLNKFKGNIFGWSDTHFYHANVISFANRPFIDINDMHTQMINNYNNTVSDNDVCIFVGDVSFKKAELTNLILDQLKGYKILICGNHDFVKKGKILDMNFNEIHPIYSLDNYIFSHYPLDNVPIGHINVHGHTHNILCSGNKHLNVCVEQINYTPILIK